jgi:hypothetical protein
MPKACTTRCPVDAAALVELLCTAERIGGQTAYGEKAEMAVRCFLPVKPGCTTLIDARSGGCSDALTPMGRTQTRAAGGGRVSAGRGGPRGAGGDARGTVVTWRPPGGESRRGRRWEWGFKRTPGDVACVLTSRQLPSIHSGVVETCSMAVVSSRMLKGWPAGDGNLLEQAGGRRCEGGAGADQFGAVEFGPGGEKRRARVSMPAGRG